MTIRAAAASILLWATLPCGARTDEHPPAPENGEDAQAVESLVADAIRSMTPSLLLADPGKLLGPVDLRERKAFLDYHSGDSAIRLHAVVVDPAQTPPPSAQLDPLVARLAADGIPVALAVYPFGKPEQAVLCFSKDVTTVVPAPELRRAVQSVLQQAAAKRTPSTQFETFLTQLSIRLYWFERLLPDTPAAAAPAPIKLETEAEAPQPPPTPSRTEQWSARIRPLVPLTLGTILMTILGTLALAVLRAKAVHRFPEHHNQTRLGAPHAAGVGAVISFASSLQAPAQQRGEFERDLKVL